MKSLSFNQAKEKDKTDGLASKRSAFLLPEDIIYLDGNSLGPVTKNATKRIKEVTEQEWGVGLVRSWNESGWVDLPKKVGAKIAPLLGVQARNVIMADSTSVNLFKVLSAVCSINPSRKRIITETKNFPTDNYIIEGVTRQLDKDFEIAYVDEPEDIISSIDESVAVVVLTHINYKNGKMLDIIKITRATHKAGALIIWDLAHSAGAVPLELDKWKVDFAVGCSYKYLNGGPGAPGYLYVADRHIGKFNQPLTGWFAHKSPFAFEPQYEPAEDITQYLCGTPPILSSIALDSALDVWADVDLQDVRRKSLELTDYFIELVEQWCSDPALQLITPRKHKLRGSQVSFTHPEGGYAIMAALIEQGVIGDFRAPNILRFGFTPLYTSFSDVWLAVDKLKTILETRGWDHPKFHDRKLVT
tara:strand:+ start:410 stop:1657 length:1248 start_codon:yes stop_codon:yes gene_type:complete